MSEYINLTSDLLLEASSVAERRDAFHKQRGTPQSKGCPPEKSLAVNVAGTNAEIAAAFYLNTLDWWRKNAATTISRGGDVWPKVQVRGTEYATGHLLLYREGGRERGDNPWHRFILARLHHLPTVELVGWIPAGDGMLESYWKTAARHPCWWVPPWVLKSMDDLRVIVNNEKGAA